MNLLAIMQPTFLPWIGYFDLIDQVDIFVFYDDVQLSRRSWQIRNRIKTPSGELYLTIPVKKSKSRDDLLICESEISYEENWQNKHMKCIEANYKKSMYFSTIFPFLLTHYEKKHALLSLFNADFITSVSEKIGITSKFITSSQLSDIDGIKDIRLASICMKLSSNEYLSPQGSANYIESQSPGGQLTKENIALYYHFYEYPVYRQLYGNFMPYISIIDLLFNEGFDNALEIIRKGRQEKVHFQLFRQNFLNLH